MTGVAVSIGPVAVLIIGALLGVIIGLVVGYVVAALLVLLSWGGAIPPTVGLTVGLLAGAAGLVLVIVGAGALVTP